MNNNKKMSVDQLHEVNKALILNLIKQSGEISRSQVSHITKLTPPTVAKIIEELVTEDKLVEYKGIGDSSGGVSLNGDFYFNMLNEKVQKYLLTPNKNMKILPSTFGEQATTIGAACLVLKKILTLKL